MIYDSNSLPPLNTKALNNLSTSILTLKGGIDLPSRFSKYCLALDLPTEFFNSAKRPNSSILFSFTCALMSCLNLASSKPKLLAKSKILSS